MENYKPRLSEVYKKDIQPLLKDELGIKNVMQLPKIEKIVINMGMGDAKDNKNSLSQAVEELSIITGQKPVVTKARNAISNFKVRIGDPVGVKVTLRGVKMYEFLDRFISISSPRIRDFRGLSAKGFDGRGNYNFGTTNTWDGTSTEGGILRVGTSISSILLDLSSITRSQAGLIYFPFAPVDKSWNLHPQDFN